MAQTLSEEDLEYLARCRRAGEIVRSINTTLDITNPYPELGRPISFRWNCDNWEGINAVQVHLNNELVYEGQTNGEYGFVVSEQRKYNILIYYLSDQIIVDTNFYTFEPKIIIPSVDFYLRSEKTEFIRPEKVILHWNLSDSLSARMAVDGNSYDLSEDSGAIELETSTMEAGEYVAELVARSYHVNIDPNAEVIKKITFQVKNPLPEICNFSSEKTHIHVGEETKLNWEVRHADNVELIQRDSTSSVEPTGSVEVKGDSFGTVEYGLFARGPGGEAQKNIELHFVAPDVNLTLESGAEHQRFGSKEKVTWRVEGAKSQKLHHNAPDWLDLDTLTSNKGSIEFDLIRKVIFTLDATGFDDRTFTKTLKLEPEITKKQKQRIKDAFRIEIFNKNHFKPWG